MHMPALFFSFFMSYLYDSLCRNQAHPIKLLFSLEMEKERSIYGVYQVGWGYLLFVSCRQCDLYHPKVAAESVDFAPLTQGSCIVLNPLYNLASNQNNMILHEECSGLVLECLSRD